MQETIVSRLLSHLNNIFDSVIASIFMLIIGLILGITAHKYRSVILNQTTRKRVADANNKGFKISTLLTVSGSRFELTKTQLTMRVTPEIFRIPFPESRIQDIKEVAPLFTFNEPVSTRAVLKNKERAKALVPNLDQLIAECTEEIADDFIVRARRKNRIFNGTLYHVLRMSSSATNNTNEDPLVSIDFLETDYFTHQVIHRSFLKALNDHSIRGLVTRGELSDLFDFFLNGFGLNCLVCAVPDVARINEAMLVFGKRSMNVAQNSASGKWHVTANEALSQTDIEDHRLSIDRWIRRALHEEVGIKEVQILRVFVFNVFIGMSDMQPGIGCLAFCEGDLDTIFSRIVGSQDGSMEYDAYKSLPFTDVDISYVLKRGGMTHEENLIPFSPSADNILRNIIARGTAAFF